MSDGDRKMFRTMKGSEDGRPAVGRSRRHLGVKVAPAGITPADPNEFDVLPNAANQVSPGRGMSVAMDEATGLPKHRLPVALGGESRDPLFWMWQSALPSSLFAHEDDPPHAMIEPATTYTLDVYEAALQETRVCWEKA